MPPRLTVITATFNGARFLPETIESVLTQTVSDFDFIIIDDGSSDETPSILERYRKQDARITILTQENRGIPSSLNRAIMAAKTELIAHIDADDRALPDWLEKQLAFLMLHPENSVVSSYAYLINADGNRIGKSQNSIDVKRGVAEKNPQLFLDIIHSTVLMRKSKLLEAGGYREGQTYLEDRDLWGRLITAGQSIQCNPEMLVEYRVHSASLTVKKHSQSDIWLGRSINLNIIRRLNGERELTPEETQAWFASLPLVERIKESQRFVAGRYFRTAARHYAEKRWLRCAYSLGVATAIRPIYVLSRVRKKVFG